MSAGKQNAACSGQQCAVTDGSGASIESVVARGLVTKKPKVQDILQVRPHLYMHASWRALRTLNVYWYAVWCC